MRPYDRPERRLGRINRRPVALGEEAPNSRIRQDCAGAGDRQPAQQWGGQEQMKAHTRGSPAQPERHHKLIAPDPGEVLLDMPRPDGRVLRLSLKYRGTPPRTEAQLLIWVWRDHQGTLLPADRVVVLKGTELARVHEAIGELMWRLVGSIEPEGEGE